MEKNASKVQLNTSIIVRFPSETEEDFFMTKEFLNRIKFDYALIFKYSERPNTAAIEIQEKIPERVKIKRMMELELVQRGILMQKLARRVIN